MKSKATNVLRVLLGLAFGLVLMAINVNAQQPSASPNNYADAKTSAKTPAKTSVKTSNSSDPAPQVGEDAGDYTVISSIEFGYRGMRVRGNVNKYQSDLNYNAGPRLFDTSFLMKAKEGKSGLFDTLLVTSTGWGADPYGNMRISVEKPEWYRFTGTYRRFKYFNFLNNLANPNFPTQPPNPITGEHGYDVRQQIGDFDLTILPKNERIRFNIGFSPERYSGPGFTTYHVGGDDFQLLSQFRSRANDFRVGADWKLGPVSFSFLQGFRRFRDDTFIDDPNRNLGANPALSNAFFTDFNRNLAARGSVNYTRFNMHMFLFKRLDITGRLIYSSATVNGAFSEAFAGLNFNTRIPGLPATYNPPNVLNLGTYNLGLNTKRPQTLGDFGVTYLATDKLRISNTFRVENFQINGGDLYTAAFFFTRNTGATLAPIIINNGGAGYGNYNVTKYRKYQDTVEADYQFNERYSVFFGYRYGTRRIEVIESGFALNANLPTVLVPVDETEENHTNAFFGGFKIRPVKNWTLYVDAERGTADNVFTRVGNYDYTNFRARSRYTPSRKLSLNFSVIVRDNSNPSEINGVSLTDFAVQTKLRTFNASADWTPNPRLAFSTGYNYNWQDSDAVIDYFYNSVRHPVGHSLYFMRNNFFYFNTTVQVNRRMMFFAAYRINKDNGQGSRLADPTGTPGFLINSYPMSFQSPEARLVIKLNRRFDWNLGYQYYNYRESPLVSINPQNYHAHLPYMSLRLYFGRSE